MIDQQKQLYEFGPFRIDSVERLLFRGQDVIPLTPKAIDTLLALVSNPGRVLEKDELMRMVWQDSFVEEGGLARNVSLLRKTIGETDEERYIETIPKRGYRFVAAVRTGGVRAEVEEKVTEAQAAPERPKVRRWLAIVVVPALIVSAALFWYRLRPPTVELAPVVSGSVNALAVLPFQNVANDPSQDYLVQGMTHALIANLSKLGNLRVISLASAAGAQGESAALETVAHEQSASLVLKGAVLRSGERVRIDAQLLDPKKRAVYWANSYERDIKDVLSLQATVAEAIVRELQVGVTAKQREQLGVHRLVKPEALDAYMRGRHLFDRRTEEGLRRAAQYFQQAIAADPQYALAYSGLADCYSLLGSIGIDGMPPTKAMPLAKAAAQKALEIDPGLAEAYVSMALVKLSYDWDLPAAAKEFSRAMALNPVGATAHQWYSHYFMAAGDLGKATEEMQTALRLEPLSPVINLGIGWCLYYSHQYDRAIEQYRAVLQMDSNYATAHQTLGMAYQQKGMYAEAIDQFKMAVSLSGNGPAAVAGLGSAYGAAGRAREARQELARLEEMSRQRYVPALYIASVHDALGDRAASFTWGWKALGERSDYFVYLQVEPRAGKLRNHPEFIKIMSRLHP